VADARSGSLLDFGGLCLGFGLIINVIGVPVAGYL
jgi:hypothetical protein